MRYSYIVNLVSIVLTLGDSAAASKPTSRQIVEPISGTIVKPTAGTVISAGSSLPFEYNNDNFCEDGYTSLTVWIIPGPDAPTSASLNSTAEFPPGTFLAYLGSFLIANFGLPNQAPGPPPSTFAVPTLDSSTGGTTVYLAVVEEEINCPPDGHPEWGLASVSLQNAT